jgi:hypothetical protein
MIEINLIAKKKKFKMPPILGMDLSSLPFKWLVLIYIASQFQDTLIFDSIRADIEKTTEQSAKLKKESKKLLRQINKNKDIEDQLKAYNRQVAKLKIRSQQVDKIVSSRSNPKLLLEKFARSMPDDLWFKSLSINDKKGIKIEGSSISYRSIGDFIISGNNFGFFGNTLNLSSSKTIEEKLDGKKMRIQEFEITGEIKTFNPWATGK